MAHKASLTKPVIELKFLLAALKKSIAWRPLHDFGGRYETISEHNLSTIGGNWEGIIGDRLSR